MISRTNKFCKIFNVHVCLTVNHVLVWLLNQLKSGNSSLMIRSVNSLKGATPSLEIIKTLLSLLNSTTADVSEAVGR